MTFSSFKRLCVVTGFVCVSALGIGCAKQEELTDLPSEGSVVKTFSVKDYLYRTVGTCEDGNLQFKVLETAGILLATDPESPFIVGQIAIYLKDDGTYVADYFEYTGDTKSSIERITGSYTVGDNSITLENLGTTEFFELGNKFGLEITFTRDIITAGLTDQKHILRSWLRTDGLVTNEEYCSGTSASLL